MRPFRLWKLDDSTQMLWDAAKREIDDVHVANLAARLEPVLAEFMHSGTGRIGNVLSPVSAYETDRGC